MNTAAIEQSVLGLPKPERAHLVHLLLDRLDAPSETDIQDIWLNEARRRAEDIDAGKVNLVSSEQLEREVQALFKLAIGSIPKPLKNTKSRSLTMKRYKRDWDGATTQNFSRSWLWFVLPLIAHVLFLPRTFDVPGSRNNGEQWGSHSN